jgi:hypothetical protein
MHPHHIKKNKKTIKTDNKRVSNNLMFNVLEKTTSPRK